MTLANDPARGPTRFRRVSLALDDREWERLLADARETGITVDQLASLILAFSCRARINHAVCLALHDITRPWAEQAAESTR